MPKVQEVVTGFFGKEPFKGVNPDEVVALGAAIQARAHVVTILCYTTLYYAILHYTTLYYTILRYTTLHYAIQACAHVVIPPSVVTRSGCRHGGAVPGAVCGAIPCYTN